MEINDLPNDIKELLDNYDHKMYKNLSVKYHPDKSSYDDKYSKFLNCVKDFNKIL
jgi:hypothetical protein